MTYLKAYPSYANQPIQSPHPIPINSFILGYNVGTILHPNHPLARYQTRSTSFRPQGLLKSFQLANPKPAHLALVFILWKPKSSLFSLFFLRSLCLLTNPGASPCAPRPHDVVLSSYPNNNKTSHFKTVRLTQSTSSS